MRHNTLPCALILLEQCRRDLDGLQKNLQLIRELTDQMFGGDRR